jgi:hypothetical protein
MHVAAGTVAPQKCESQAMFSGTCSQTAPGDVVAESQRKDRVKILAGNN